jgi:hypothetical protein
MQVSSLYSFVTAILFQVFLDDEPCHCGRSPVFRRLFASVEVTYQKYIAALEIKTYPSRPVLLTKTTELGGE